MKKMKFVLIIIIILTAFFASCSSKEYRSEPKASPTSTPQKVHSVLKDEATSEESTTTDEDFPSEDKIASTKAAFEKLREAVIEANPYHDENWKKIYNYLANISPDRIMVAMAINPLVSIKREDGSAPFYCYIACTEYDISMGEFVQMFARLQPVRIDINDDGEVVNILIPNVKPSFDTHEEIAAVFGLSEYEFPFTFELEEYHDYLFGFSKELSIFIYDIALNGGFDGFNNETIEIIKTIHEKDLQDNSLEAKIRQSIMAQSFLFGSIMLPIWHEIGAEDKDGIKTVYTAMYFSRLYINDNEEYIPSAEIIPTKVEVIDKNDDCIVNEYRHMIQGGELYEETIKAAFNDYADDYFTYYQSDEYIDFATFCDSVMDSIISGTIDYTNDSLNYKN